MLSRLHRPRAHKMTHKQRWARSLACGSLIAASLVVASPGHADQSVTYVAPFESGTICYKDMVLHYLGEYCPADQFPPAQQGILVAGGLRNPPGDPRKSAPYAPYVSRSRAGSTFVTALAGTLTVTAVISGARAGMGSAITECLNFDTSSFCSDGPVDGNVTGTQHIAAGSFFIDFEVQAWDPGAGAAHLDSLALHFVPDEVSILP
ncbi:MAG: hypothetical protein LC723_14700 [Actinobacteria bacterium]|nr:hypothetical protein [Actinomycetota bacterium]